MILAPATIATIPGLQAALDAKAALSGADFTGAVSVGGGTSEFSGLGLGTAYSQRLNATWANGATTFTALQVNVTDATSAADSKLLHLRVGGATKVEVLKSGWTSLGANSVFISADVDSIAYVMALTRTWDNAAVAFSAIDLNVADTASLSESLLLNLRVSNASKFSVRKDGLATAVALSTNILRANYLNNEANSATHLFLSDSLALRLGSTLFQFNGTTASFPALKRDGTTIEARLADDSDYADLRCSTHRSSIVRANYLNNEANSATHLFLSDSLALRLGSTLFQFNGTTASFPALKRDGTTIQARLADDSGYADLQSRRSILSESMEVADLGSTPAAVAGKAVLWVENNGAGKLQLLVRFPTGAPQLIKIEA